MERIEADLLIPGRGDPIRDATQVLDGGRIAFAGPAGNAAPTPDAAMRETGAIADVIMVDGDPLVDLKLLADPTRIPGVRRAGRRVKY
jgi:hypothetical protein